MPPENGEPGPRLNRTHPLEVFSGTMITQRNVVAWKGIDWATQAGRPQPSAAAAAADARAVPTLTAGPSRGVEAPDHVAAVALDGGGKCSARRSGPVKPQSRVRFDRPPPIAYSTRAHACTLHPARMPPSPARVHRHRLGPGHTPTHRGFHGLGGRRARRARAVVPHHLQRRGVGRRQAVAQLLRRGRGRGGLTVRAGPERHVLLSEGKPKQGKHPLPAVCPDRHYSGMVPADRGRPPPSTHACPACMGVCSPAGSPGASRFRGSPAPAAGGEGGRACRVAEGVTAASRADGGLRPAGPGFRLPLLVWTLLAWF